MDNPRENDIQKQIDAYVKGQLSEAEIQELWLAFAQRPELLEQLEIEVSVKKIIEDKMSVPREKVRVSKLPVWTWQVAAAAVIAIVALVQIFRVETPTDMSDFLVQEISPANLETPDVLRDNETMVSTADSLLNLGFEAALSGNDERAMELYDMVIAKHDEEPYGSKAFLNKGILLYNKADYEAAVDAFKETVDRVNDSRMITEKAQWYLGNALINIGKLEEAQKAIFEAYQLEGVFRNPAFRLLKKLSDDLGTSDYEGLSPQKVK